MIQILYEALGGRNFKPDLEHGAHEGPGDHEERAKALAAVIPGSNCSAVKIVSGVQKPGLDTLVYWGHGTSMGLCGMSPQQFVDDVAAWKKWNAAIKTVEIITCNARHPGLSDLSFIQAMKPLLKKKCKDIVIKAFPMGMGSSAAHGFSILLAHAPTRTWAYITGGGATDTSEMWPGANLVKAAARDTGGDLNQAGQVVQTANPTRAFGLMFGAFTTLRNALIVIH